MIYKYSIVVFFFMLIAPLAKAGDVPEAEKQRLIELFEGIKTAAQEKDVNKVLSYMDKEAEILAIGPSGQQARLTYDDYETLLKGLSPLISNYNYRILSLDIAYADDGVSYLVNSEIKEMFFINSQYVKQLSRQQTWVRNLEGELIVYKVIIDTQ